MENWNHSFEIYTFHIWKSGVCTFFVRTFVLWITCTHFRNERKFKWTVSKQHFRNEAPGLEYYIALLCEQRIRKSVVCVCVWRGQCETSTSGQRGYNRKTAVQCCGDMIFQKAPFVFKTDSKQLTAWWMVCLQVTWSEANGGWSHHWWLSI